MRISDWSSDVCSSDLQIAAKRPRWRSGLWVVLCLLINQDCLLPSAWRLVGAVNATRPAARSFLSLKQFVTGPFNAALTRLCLFRVVDPTEDRKSGVEGKSVSDRVVLGGRRLLKKKIKEYY